MVGSGSSDPVCWRPGQGVVVRVEDERWSLDPAFQAEVDRYFGELRRGAPALFRGPVLTIADRWRDDWNRLRISARFTDFAHFLYSRRFLQPGHPYHVKVVTAACWVTTADGRVVLAEAAPKTARPRRVQTIGGGPAAEDFANGFFLATRSAARELREETGLVAEGKEAGAAVHKNGSVVVVVRFHLPEPWDEVRPRIAAHLAAESTPELSRVFALSAAEIGEALSGRDVLDTVRTLLTVPELWPSSRLHAPDRSETRHPTG